MRLFYALDGPAANMRSEGVLMMKKLLTAFFIVVSSAVLKGDFLDDNLAYYFRSVV